MAVHPLVMDYTPSNEDLEGSLAVGTETKTALKYLEVQKRRAQLDIMEILVKMSRQSMKVPIPLPTSALNLLVYLKLLI